LLLLIPAGRIRAASISFGHRRLDMYPLVETICSADDTPRHRRPCGNSPSRWPGIVFRACQLRERCLRGCVLVPAPVEEARSVLLTLRAVVGPLAIELGWIGGQVKKTGEELADSGSSRVGDHPDRLGVPLAPLLTGVEVAPRSTPRVPPAAA